MLITIKDRIRFSKRTITDEGYLVVKDSRIARTGIQEYLAIELAPAFSDREPTDIIRVYRPPEEVFNDESMKSFELAPVTNNHPPEGVNAENFKDKSVGVASNIQKDGIFLKADLRITDGQAVKDVEAGKKELSNGYQSELEVKDGVTPDGDKYDAVQRQIRGNHVAIVDAARCGPRCSISDTKPINQPNVKGVTMNLTIDGVPFDVADETLAGAIKKSIAKASDAATKLSTQQTNHDAVIAKLQAKHDDEVQKLQARVDDAEANAMTPEKLDKVIDERVAIITSAQKIIANFDGTGKTCMAIKREVVRSKFGDSISAEKMKNDVYVNARFDALAEVENEDEDEEDESKTTNTDKVMGDSASKTKSKTADASIIARRRKMIGDKIAYKFAPGSRGTEDFEKAVDREYQKQHGAA